MLRENSNSFAATADLLPITHLTYMQVHMSLTDANIYQDSQQAMRPTEGLYRMSQTVIDKTYYLHRGA